MFGLDRHQRKTCCHQHMDPFIHFFFPQFPLFLSCFMEKNNQGLLVYLFYVQFLFVGLSWVLPHRAAKSSLYFVFLVFAFQS